MIDPNEEKNHWSDDDEDSGGTGSSGAGGQDGALAFHDFVFVHEERQLSPEQEKQLLVQHKEANGALVEKQKQLRDQRNNQKEGKVNSNQWGGGQGERTSAFLKHPVLGEAAEFDGIDPQVNLDPTIYDAETNSEKKEELVYQHQLRLGLENEPRLNIKPSPF